VEGIPVLFLNSLGSKVGVITINVPVVYMAQDVMTFMRENQFREPLAGVGPENRDFFGPSNGNERSECHLGPKKSRFVSWYCKSSIKYHHQRVVNDFRVPGFLVVMIRLLEHPHQQVVSLSQSSCVCRRSS
jgi:hypothetical protein